jgi:single-strand DNA-binding protein
MTEDATWFKVTLWRKQAENASKFLSKGRQVYVEGRLQVEEWTDRDGKVRYSLVIQGSELQFLGEKGGESTSNSQTASDNNFDDNTNDFKRVENTSAPADDDIPF